MPAKRSVLGPLPVGNLRRAQNNRKRDGKAGKEGDMPIYSIVLLDSENSDHRYRLTTPPTW